MVSAAAIVVGLLGFQEISSSGPTEWGVNVVASYPHDPSAYTQGLTIYNGEMYEGTGQYGRSTIRQVELSTGVVGRQKALRPEYFGEGITVFNNELYQLTWTSGLVFVYDLETFTLLRTLSLIHI